MLTEGCKSETSSDLLSLDGASLSLECVQRVAFEQAAVSISEDPTVANRVQAAVDSVLRAVEERQEIYGVTTGFGGMASQSVPQVQTDHLQNNLVDFLSTGAGDWIDDRHVRGALLLRANVLLRGCSGVRMEIIRRLIGLLQSQAIPQVRELGSIGASGDLVPLSVLARAITGNPHCRVRHGDRILDGPDLMDALGWQPIPLQAKEGLALVNGTSFSAAIAANCVIQSRTLMALSMLTQSMLMRALQVKLEPFAEFVQRCKPHPGQIWSGRLMEQMLTSGSPLPPLQHQEVQDRYSLRCYPQYHGAIVEGLAKIQKSVEIEMNSVSDNPLIDSDQQRFYQGGNFLGQYLAIAMDELRRHIGLMAKHLDVQIATLVTPEFSHGLSPSLRGNNRNPCNMGLKGLQITCNSIMPQLTYLANPLTEHFPTHAEQFNQNINGLCWGSSQMAWRSVQQFQQYLSAALLFAVQAIDLRAEQEIGHFNGRELLGNWNRPLYDAIHECLDNAMDSKSPFLFDDSDRWLEQDLEALAQQLEHQGGLTDCTRPVWILSISTLRFAHECLRKLDPHGTLVPRSGCVGVR